MKEYIVITPSNLKKKVIELSRKKYYNYNIKFMSINEFIDKYTFSYDNKTCLLYTSPSPRDRTRSRMPSSA